MDQRNSETGSQSSTESVRGRPFPKGNGGRKPGSTNRSTVIAAAVLEGDQEALIRKAVELAKAGDVPMLKFLLGRLLPRERIIKFDLPTISFADDATKALDAVAGAVADGRLSPNEAGSLATLIDATVRSINVADLVQRVDNLEAIIKGWVKL